VTEDIEKMSGDEKLRAMEALWESNSPIDQVSELTGANVGVGTPRLYSPAVEEILVWPQGVATKYRDQLEEH
jgi:hypothetical protein